MSRNSPEINRIVSRFLVGGDRLTKKIEDVIADLPRFYPAFVQQQPEPVIRDAAIAILMLGTYNRGFLEAHRTQIKATLIGVLFKPYQPSQVVTYTEASLLLSCLGNAHLYPDGIDIADFEDFTLNCSQVERDKRFLSNFFWTQLYSRLAASYQPFDDSLLLGQDPRNPRFYLITQTHKALTAGNELVTL